MYQTRSTLNNIRKVYSWLGDEESRLIFREKLLYQIVDPSEKNICLHKIWQYREPERYRKLQKICNLDNEVILYGAGGATFGGDGAKVLKVFRGKGRFLFNDTSF